MNEININDKQIVSSNQSDSENKRGGNVARNEVPVVSSKKPKSAYNHFTPLMNEQLKTWLEDKDIIYLAPKVSMALQIDEINWVREEIKKRQQVAAEVSAANKKVKIKEKRLTFPVVSIRVVGPRDLESTGKKKYTPAPEGYKEQVSESFNKLVKEYDAMRLLISILNKIDADKNTTYENVFKEVLDKLEDNIWKGGSNE